MKTNELKVLSKEELNQIVGDLHSLFNNGDFQEEYNSLSEAVAGFEKDMGGDAEFNVTLIDLLNARLTFGPYALIFTAMNCGEDGVFPKDIRAQFTTKLETNKGDASEEHY